MSPKLDGFNCCIIEDKNFVDNSGNPFEQVLNGFCFNNKISSGLSPNFVISFKTSYR